MEQIKLEEKYILEYIRDVLESCKTKTVEINDARYHHNTSYKDISSIIKYGLLSKRKQVELENKTLSERDWVLFSDDGHVNGLDNISLAVVGLKDIYRDEMVYDPYMPRKVDILISNDIKAGRNSINYGNEFLVQHEIENKYFKSIDLRILKYVVEFKNSQNLHSIRDLIEKYNYLSKISQSLLDNNLDIPMRDMSFDNITLDKEKVIELPKLILKK